MNARHNSSLICIVTVIAGAGILIGSLVVTHSKIIIIAALLIMCVALVLLLIWTFENDARHRINGAEINSALRRLEWQQQPVIIQTPAPQIIQIEAPPVQYQYQQPQVVQQIEYQPHKVQAQRVYPQPQQQRPNLNRRALE